ncbi:winged helix-turn-helix transcriptional regulator [Streptomyces sp. NPDC088354]|uniref:winged helix-turn-helix transcriptional regulator n=1 Tax=unclassified Streptomyces TaxID=2593676 RepID=UPI0029B338D8|nr:helix-turn-helix domain-containing protein [Streptomyces sp. MI02-7b]MDX3072264.1 helix-turn-helix domain-containing protein [Streptomyces sp. MI02-7b]
MMPRRSYDQYCAVARALDTVGERWTLLIVRELLAGPRRYTDLHADLPGVSTDVLASRLKEMERDQLVTRRRLPPPGAAYVYELTPRGRDLLSVLGALAAWGTADLGEPRPTDAVRAHWAAVPLMRRLAALPGLPGGVVEVRLDEGAFHIELGGPAPSYADGPAKSPDAVLALPAGARALPDALGDGAAEVTGEGPLADALRGAGA